MQRAAFAFLLGTVIAHVAVAADATSHISGLQEHSDLPMPSAARVVIAVVVTLALAAGVLVLAKRVLPKLSGNVDFPGQTIKVLARTHISRSLTAHVVEVDANRILIVEGRTGIQLTLLPRIPAGEAQPRS